MDKIAHLRALIEADSSLTAICAVRMALKDLDNGDYDNAMAWLRSEADKFVGKSSRGLYDFVTCEK